MYIHFKKNTLKLNKIFFSKSHLILYLLIFFIVLIKLPTSLYAQKEIMPCQKEPDFIKTLGFDPLWTALSTSDKRSLGIILVEFEKKENQKSPTPQNSIKSIYQHDSWKSAGYLSTITFDINGNAYTIPTPLISVFYNPKEKLNTIYQINGYTGILTEWLSLPYYKSASSNPYGLLGISYDCISNLMFASTVLGSKRKSENGIIYIINVANKKIVDSLLHKDAIGLTIALDEKGNKRLYYGSARTGDIISVPINANGKFNKKMQRNELSLKGYGPRGDDKPRKIKFANSTMLVNGISFNYNLQASSEKPETLYTFKWNSANKKWELLDMN